MKVLKRYTIPVCLGLLAACTPASDTNAEPEPAETAIPVEPEGGAGNGATPLPEVSGKIPANFHGVWDYVEGTCAPESDLRIEIKPDAVQFYESHGDVVGIEIVSPDRIVVSLAMEGEGEKWQMARQFELSNNGQTLTPSAAGEDSYEPMPLKKCPS